MKKKKQHNKPSGRITTKHVTLEGIKLAEDKFVFPKTKSEIEIKIAKLFLKMTKAKKELDFIKNFELVENEENNIDFMLIDKTDKTRKIYLELTELIPPGSMKKGYDSLPKTVFVGEYSEKILKLIRKKSNKYLGLNSEVYLLMYTSDYKSIPSLYVETLVKDFLNKIPLKFSRIFLIIPSLNDSGPLINYFPNDQRFLSFQKVESLKRLFSLPVK